MSRPKRMIEPIICGIYKIISPIGNIYIGQAIDIYWRWDGYKRNGAKGSYKLHISFKRYGIENHTFEIIRECKRHHLNFFEKYYEKMLGSWNTLWALNVRECGGSKGKVDEESKKKISIKNSGPWSQEKKNKQKQTRKKNGTDKQRPETIALRIATIRANGGYIKTEEQKIQHSKSMIGKNIGKPIGKGIPKSESHKVNIVIAQLGTKQKQETIYKRETTRKANKEKKESLLSPKIKKEYKINDEQIKNISEGTKLAMFNMNEKRKDEMKRNISLGAWRNKLIKNNIEPSEQNVETLYFTNTVIKVFKGHIYNKIREEKELIRQERATMVF